MLLIHLCSLTRAGLLAAPALKPAACAPASLTDAPGHVAGQDLKITKFHSFKPLFM
jgi:hypothetical protein